MRPQALSLAVGILLCLNPSQARALPVFAHRYGFSCQACHTTVPHLNPFGNAFLRAGFRLPAGSAASGAFPVAVKINFAYSSNPNPSTLPKVVLDELEFLSAAAATSHISYRLEQYAVNGGVPGSTRDAWLRFTSRPEFGDSKPALRLTAGQFTLPLPNDPETQRDSLNHYGVFDQTVGSNAFNLFDPRIGLDAAYGREGGFFDVHALAIKGHDPQSGRPTLGVDRMYLAQVGRASTIVTAYRYEGLRPLGPVNDRFWRQAIGANEYWGSAELDVLAQAGHDSSADGLGLAVNSSGGFGQLRWSFAPRLISVMRYDEARAGRRGVLQTVTTTLIFRPQPNMRLTLESVSGSGRGAVNAAWLVAY